MAAAESSFPVWVGNLAPRITESVLLDLFGKFGPVKNVTVLKDASGISKQCGFVSFCSYDVSKAAAIGLDGCDVFGQIIETRGPDKLALPSQPTKASRQENNDGKVLLDCVHFVERKRCPFKVGQCPYRHCADTQNTEKICEKWLNYECRDVNCVNRHPVINILKDTIEADKEKEQSRTMPQQRCPSHNAYKCTGECGDVDCETHFIELDDMVQHLRKARDKTSAVPSGVCAGCKAVFFSEEERKKHSCFQPKHQQTPFIPIYHPITGSTSVSKPSCSCSPDANGNRPVTTCTACGSCYEHSGDSLSTFECSPGGIGYGGHKCPNSPSVRNSNISDGKQCVELEPIGVFWDIENCPVPRGKSAVDIVKKIREEFFTNKREVEFMCVCDISKEKKEVIEELNKSQVTVVHINATSKNAADDKLRQSLRRFAQSYPPPATVILVSGDINFAAELSDLRHRHNLTVICLHNAQAQSALLACAHESKRFDLFTNDLAVSSAKTSENNSVQTELSIGNLPIGKDVAQIKIRLKKLSDNCGGKVASITGRTAVLKFPNHQSAARAKKRMENEDVFGSLIQATYPVSKPGVISPPRNTRVSQALKIDGTFDLVNKVPQRLGKTKREIKKITEPSANRMIPPPVDRHHVANEPFRELYDEELEEILCAPPSKLPVQNAKPLLCSSAATMPLYPNQQPLFSNASCTYSTSWQYPYYQGLVHVPSQGVGYPIPVMGPHPITASWLANLHSLSILEQQKGGVDIVVCNLDDTVSRKELKKKLASVFREHCKVYSVVLHMGEGIPLRAFVKVPKLSDAQIAMSKVNNQKIFSTSVSVTIATEKEKDLCFLSSEVTSVLKDAPLHWMALNKFLSFFYEKCSHPFDMNVLAMLPDIVTIIGKPGCEAICLASPGLRTVKVLVRDCEVFAREVHMLLKQHKGYLLLANFAASYWLKFDKRIEVNEQGVRLSDALQAVVNVLLKVDTGKDVVCWVKEGIINGGVFNKLDEFSFELQDLLKTQPKFRLPLSHLISAYQKWFNRKSPFDPVNYGFSSVKDLLEALPNVIQVQEDGVERFVVLTPKFKLKVFEAEVRILLEAQADCCLSLDNFMTVYQRFFGHRCCIADYGLDTLVDVMDKISHVVKVHTNGEDRVVSLVDTGRANKTPPPVTMETLAYELKHLLSMSDKQQLPVSMVMSKYYEQYGRHFNIAKTGFASLENMLTSIIPGAKVNEVRGEKFICLPSKRGYSGAVKDLIELVSEQDGAFLPLKRLPALYRKHFSKKLPLTMEKLHDAVRTTDKELQILGADNDQILCYTDISEKDQQSNAFKKLTSDLHSMLIKFPGCRMSHAALDEIYHRQRGTGTITKRWPEFSNLDSLLHAMSDSIEVTGTGDFASVCLKQEYVLRCLAHDIVSVLSSYTGKTILVSNMPKLYEKNIGRPLCTHHYGFVDLSDMLDAMCSVVKVVGEGKKRVHLSPLQLFAIEAKQLLIHQGGCVSLNRFAPCFQQYYNRPCKAADYGYARLSEVIAAVPNLAEIRGNGIDKMVVLIADGDVLLECIGLQVASGCKTSEQTQHGNDSPPIIYEGSDTESVIVEEELYDSQDPLVQDAKAEDLIVLSGVDEPNENGPLSDWMMAPVPKTLPEPDLHPQQGHRPSGQQEPQAEKDLISFREFEPDLSLAGLKQIHTVGLLKQPSNDISQEDMKVFVVNKTSVEGNIPMDYQSTMSGKRQQSLSSGPSDESPRDHRLALSPGMRDLSDVEAEILNVNRKGHGGDVESVEKTSKCKKRTRHHKPILAAFIHKPEEKTTNKKVSPVKLAVNFSMATKN